MIGAMKTLLVVDGDNRVRNIARLLFTESMGYKVVTAVSGQEAVSKARKIKPEVVLSNIYLDDGDGYRVSKEIKNDPLLRNTIVLLLCPEFASRDSERIMESGADDVITKPIGREVVDKVESLLSQIRKANVEFTLIHLRKNLRNIIELSVSFWEYIELKKYTSHQFYQLTWRTAKKGLNGFSQKARGFADGVKLTTRKQRDMETRSWLRGFSYPEVSFLPLARANLPLVLLTITILTVAYMFFSFNGEIQKHFYNFLSSFRTTKGFTFSQSRTDRIGETDIINFPKEHSTTMDKGDSGFGSDVCHAYSNGVEDHLALLFRYDFKTLPVGETKIIEKSPPQKKEKTARVSPDSNSLKAQFSGDKYSVKKGDNLFRIARKFNSSVGQLKALNNLRSDNIRIGQLLIVPKVQEEKPKQRIKVVKKKDDLDSIKIDRSSFYQTVGGLPVHSLTLSNEGDMTYRDIKLKISYYSSLGMEMGYETMTLPIVVPPHSRKNYIKEGISIKPNQGDVYSANVEILGATPLMRIVDEVRLDE